MSQEELIKERTKLNANFQNLITAQYTDQQTDYSNEIKNIETRIDELNKLIKENPNQPGLHASRVTLAQQGKNSPWGYGGSKKVTFIKAGKKNTRKVQVNKRGTKFVRFNGKDIPVSRLKLV